ncbi:unnamed protein product [Rhizophagus irregularis]|nr:unnamed protein product [Rhizophagus irregularis]
MIMSDKLGLSYLIKNYNNIECYLLMILLQVVDVHSTMMSNVSITSKMYVDVGNKGRCPRQPYSPEAADTIAGWIKSVIQISSPTSTAKDCGLHQS